MLKIVPVVEGDGEITAVLVLLNKVLKELKRYDLKVARPKNAHGRANLLKEGGLERFVELAWREPDCGAVLVLLDVEEGCPLDLAMNFSRRVQALGFPIPVVIVGANRMYENWFLASLETIRGRDLEGRPGLPADAPIPKDVEAENGKGWINAQMPDGRSYKENLDQEVMTGLLDTGLARERSRSFRRLYHAIEQALEAIDTGRHAVTPVFPNEAPPPAASSAASPKRGSGRKR